MTTPPQRAAPATIEGACHCGAVRFTLRGRPEHLTRCNCSLCRRVRGLWAHAPVQDVTLSYDPDAVIRYVQGDRTLALISCRTCGGTTHWEGLDPTLAILDENLHDIAGIRAQLEGFEDPDLGDLGRWVETEYGERIRRVDEYVQNAPSSILTPTQHAGHSWHFKDDPGSTP